jgi:hypothetical protein
MWEGSSMGFFAMNIAHKEEGKKNLEEEEKEEFCRKESHRASLNIKKPST